MDKITFDFENNSVAIDSDVQTGVFDMPQLSDKKDVILAASGFVEVDFTESVDMINRLLNGEVSPAEFAEYTEKVEFEETAEQRLAERRAAVIEAINSMELTAEPSRTIVVDTETTGFNPETDEVLQVSIIDGEGEVLYDSYIKPVAHTEWENAMEVNGITPEMVAAAPTIDEEMPKIAEILKSASVVVGYNCPFDLDFLAAYGCEIDENAKIVDVMRMFAPIFGEWDKKRKDYKWKKLSFCAEYYGYEWGNTTAHNSLADCYATLHCYKAIVGTK